MCIGEERGAGLHIFLVVGPFLILVRRSGHNGEAGLCHNVRIIIRVQDISCDRLSLSLLWTSWNGMKCETQIFHSILPLSLLTQGNAFVVTILSRGFVATYVVPRK